MNKNYINDVKAIMNKMGEKVIDEEYYQNITMWCDWYGQSVKEFYNYTIYNGYRNVKCKRYAMGLPKLACQEWASLLFNDKTTIQVDSDKNMDTENGIVYNPNQELLNTILENNKFDIRFTGLIEKTFAFGTGATIVYRNADGSAKIDYIIAPMIFPLRVENGEIVDVAFVSIIGDEYYVNMHKLENGIYHITNRFFKFAENQLSEVVHDNVLDTTSPIKLFQIYKPNIENNIDLFTPYGLSVFANAIDDIKACDSAYDSFRNEFDLGKKRVFLKTDVLSYKTVTNADGSTSQLPIFDENQTEFYSYDSEDGEAIKEMNPQLRVNEHISGLQTLLNIFGNAVGFGNDHYSFNEGKVYTNTTNLISSQSQMYKNLVKHEKVLRNGIIELVKAIMYVQTKKPFDGDITVDFDDSIIEDTAETKRQALLELSAGIIDKIEYLVQVYKMSETQATAFNNKIMSRINTEVEEDKEF